MPPSIVAAILDALALLMPVDCAGCGTPDRVLCENCARELDAIVTRSRLRDGTALVSALRYEGVVRHVILAFKEQGRTDVASALARPLESALALVMRDELTLVTVPPSRSGYRRRGYDPTVFLLRRAGFRPTRVLAIVRATRAQKLLDATERAENRRGSLRARGNLAGQQFVLVDDVVTTGATTIEAARAIRAAGGLVVAVVTLASTPKILRDF